MNHIVKGDVIKSLASEWFVTREYTHDFLFYFNERIICSLYTVIKVL